MKNLHRVVIDVLAKKVSYEGIIIKFNKHTEIFKLFCPYNVQLHHRLEKSPKKILEPIEILKIVSIQLDYELKIFIR